MFSIFSCIFCLWARQCVMINVKKSETELNKTNNKYEEENCDDKEEKGPNSL